MKRANGAFEFNKLIECKHYNRNPILGRGQPGGGNTGGIYVCVKGAPGREANMTFVESEKVKNVKNDGFQVTVAKK